MLYFGKSNIIQPQYSIAYWHSYTLKIHIFYVVYFIYIINFVNLSVYTLFVVLRSHCWHLVIAFTTHR